jgi:hypothetical protein
VGSPEALSVTYFIGERQSRRPAVCVLPPSNVLVNISDTNGRSASSVFLLALG